MALAVASASSTIGTVSNSCTVNKPSGLSAGDLMVAQFGQIDTNGNLQTMTPPAGWITIRTDDGGIGQTANARSQLSYKVANNSDVITASFTGTMTNSGTGVGTIAGNIARITGTTVGLSIPSAQNAAMGAGGTSETYAMTITPPDANSLLLFFMCRNQDCTSSNYAIVTSNPTWTNIWDNTTTTAGEAISLTLAAAVRTATTATGDASDTVSVSAASRNVGQLISIFQAPAPINANNNSFLAFI